MSELESIPFAPDMPTVVELHPDPTLTLSQFVEAQDENAREPLVVSDQGTALPAGGLGFLAGRASDGKTTFAVDFSLHAEAGTDYLGLSFPRPVRVLWIQNEGPREAFREKIGRRLQTWSRPASPRIWDEPASWRLVKMSSSERASACNTSSACTRSTL